MSIKIWTDGGALNNPGPAAGGICIEIREGDKLKKKIYSEYFGETTNNVAEYKALIFALKKIRLLVSSEKLKKADVNIFLDSELVVNQLNNKYKIEEEYLIPLFIEAHNFLVDFSNIKINHILREKNKEANELVQNELRKHKKESKLF